MGNTNSLLSLNHLVKTDKDDIAFPQRSQTAHRSAKFVLMSDSTTLLNNNIKKPYSINTPIFQATDI